MAQATPSTTDLDRVFDAVRENDYKELSEILERNQNIDLNIKKDGTYPLHMCIGYVECVKILLEYGAQPNHENENNKEPIHLAVERDFVETLMFLVIHGANFNAVANGKTPLQIAMEEHSQTCQDFLHFIGAEVPENHLNKIDKDAKDKYDIMKKGFADRKIVSGWAEIPAKCNGPIPVVINRVVPNTASLEDGGPNKHDDKQIKQTNVVISIQGYDDSFIVFVRKMTAEFQQSSTRVPEVPIPDGMNLISDIYQYRVDKNVTCDLHINIPVSGVDTSDKYKELVVVQMSFGPNNKEVCVNVNIQNNKAVIKGINLYAHGSSPFVAFGIFSSIKTDKKAVDPNQDLKIQSSVEELFKVEVKAGCAPADTEIHLQVIKAERKSESRDSGIGSHTDFHSVSSMNATTSDESSDGLSQGPVTNLSRPASASSRNTGTGDDVYIRLPKPVVVAGSQLVVMDCGQGKDGSDPSNWNRLENVTDIGNTVECKNADYANYIVLSVKKISYLLKEFVSDLFSRSKGDKQKCKLFAMVNHQENTTKYLVQVVLCHCRDYKERRQDCLNRKFRDQDCGPTDDLDIDSKCRYMLKLDLYYAKTVGPDSMPIQYQGELPKSQTFTVVTSGDKPACGMVLSFKKDVPKKKEHFGKKCKATLAIQFSACKLYSITTDSVWSDRFIDDVAQTTVGEKWFSLGIYLGFTCRELCALEDSEPMRRSAMILYKWRDAGSTMDEKLDNFVVATRQAELPRLRKQILGDVIKFRNANNQLDQWVRKYEAEGRDDQEIKFRLSLLQTKPVSPLSDQFLLFIARKLSADDRLFIELGLTKVEIEQRISNQEHRKCKLLMRARDKNPEETAFLRKFMKTLSGLNYNLQLQEISACAKNWLNSDEAQKAHVDARTMEDLRKLFK